MCGPDDDERERGAQREVVVGQVDVPVPHMVHGLSSAPRGRCTVWECTMFFRCVQRDPHRVGRLETRHLAAGVRLAAGVAGAPAAQDGLDFGCRCVPRVHDRRAASAAGGRAGSFSAAPRRAWAVVACIGPHTIFYKTKTTPNERLKDRLHARLCGASQNDGVASLATPNFYRHLQQATR